MTPLSAAAFSLVISMGPQVSQPSEVMRDPSVLRQAWDLLRSAQYGNTEREHAAFVVLDSDGQYRFVPWPWGAEYLKATYQGTIPDGTVAVVHTHPNRQPFPSVEDTLLAERMRIPVYVLTRHMVSSTRQGERQVDFSGDWNPNRAGRGAAPAR
jgi:hypothetical protein